MTTPSLQPVLLESRDLSRQYALPTKLFQKRQYLQAVNQVNLKVYKGETLALVGESGSGKTTLAKMLLGLIDPTSGQIYFDGSPMSERRIQPIFQDPYSSLNPSKTIESIVSLPLRVHRIGDKKWQERAVTDMLDLVGLPKRLMFSTPGEMSGGQRQRVAIARALISKPDLVICDEPTSALDVSVQAQILNLLQDLQSTLGLTYLVITHNLSVVQHLANRVAVMYSGQIVEQAAVSDLFLSPQHAYTKTLLNSMLSSD